MELVNTKLCIITRYCLLFYLILVLEEKMEVMCLNVYLFRRCKGKLLVQLWWYQKSVTSFMTESYDQL